ncbi:MAG: hypothetical protein U0990_09020 [Candidatus Nanopelagicales bacterium]|nr:hypothetical protein [Candidatus Nanopelagicales bacterium]
MLSITVVSAMENWLCCAARLMTVQRPARWMSLSSWRPTVILGGAGVIQAPWPWV